MNIICFFAVASALLISALPIYAEEVSCNNDVSQMTNQISTYGSIQVFGCRSCAIQMVSSPFQSSATECQATCQAPNAPTTSFSCWWQLGNWGSTLACASVCSYSSTPNSK